MYYLNSVDFNTVGKDLSHLSDDNILALLNEYYFTNKSVKNILNDFNLEFQANKLVQNLPLLLSNYICQFCDTRMLQKPISRTTLKTQDMVAFCNNCGHKNVIDCNCEECLNIEENKLSIKREMIIEEYSIDKNDYIEFTTLSFEDFLDLSVLLSSLLSVDNSYLHSTENLSEILSYSSNNVEFLKNMYEKKLISPHVNSPLSAFVDNDNFPNTFYVTLVNWCIRIKHTDLSYLDLLQFITKPPEEYLLDHIEEVLEIWKEIAFEESLIYLKNRLSALRIEFNPGEKTSFIIRELLTHFSTGQVYAAIYSSVARAHTYGTEHNYNKNRIANLCISNLESYGRRALENDWIVEPYERNITQSKKSEIFYYSITNLGNFGFTVKPNIDFLTNKISNSQF